MPSSNELFGKNTGGGFADLRLLDSNADGVIDAKDVAFSSLRVWVDANANAITDAGELKTLADLGISSISLTTRTPNANEATINGNEVTAIGSYTRTDGTTRAIADVNLTYIGGAMAGGRNGAGSSNVVRTRANAQPISGAS